MNRIMRYIIVFALSGLVQCSRWVDEALLPIVSWTGSAFITTSEEAQDIEISGQVVDGLDRPVAKARVKVVPRASGPRTPFAETLTEKDGRFSCKVAQERAKVAIIIEKEGYHATLECDKRNVYQLRKEFDWELARRLPKLHGEELDQGLMELWAQWAPTETFDADKYYFKYQTVFRPALRRLLKDDRLSADFRDWLDFWGDPADQDLFPGKRITDQDLFPVRRRYVPRRDVREEDLADAIKVASNQTKGPDYYKKHPEERIGIEFIVFNVEMDRAMVACGIDSGPSSRIFALFVFHKEDKKWVLRSSQPVGGQ